MNECVATYECDTAGWSVRCNKHGHLGGFDTKQVAEEDWQRHLRNADTENRRCVCAEVVLNSRWDYLLDKKRMLHGRFECRPLGVCIVELKDAVSDPRFDALVAELEELASTLRAQAREHRAGADKERWPAAFAAADSYDNAANLINQIIRDEKWGIPLKDEEPGWRSMGEAVDHILSSLEQAQQLIVGLEIRVKKAENRLDLMQQELDARGRRLLRLEDRVDGLERWESNKPSGGPWSATSGERRICPGCGTWVGGSHECEKQVRDDG